MDEMKHFSDDRESQDLSVKEHTNSNDNELPSYDVVWVTERYRADAIKKLIELVNEKMKQGYIPVGGFFMECSEMPCYHRAYQAMMLPKES